jgi:hypothetical protein
MKETAKQMFEAALFLAPGLQNFGRDLEAEIRRQGTQTSMELASALFNGSAFVPYGPGQYTPSLPEHGQDQAVEQVQEHQHEMEHER